MVAMGLQMGLEKGQFCKRQHRWMFKVDATPTEDGIIGDPEGNAINALPPEKSARPSIGFKEMMVHHLIEDVYYPAKAEWRPINITVFDLKKQRNMIFEWLLKIYDPQGGQFFEPNKIKDIKKGFIRECSLEMYDGCGNIVERWIYEDAWPQSINFQTLDMNQHGIMMAEISLRYARAYII